MGKIHSICVSLILGIVMMTAPARAENRLNPVVINIEGMQFSPKEVSTSFGRQIEWVNHDLVPHTVTSPGTFDSKTISPGKSWKFTAKKKGHFGYKCLFHPSMSGSLEVQ